LGLSRLRVYRWQARRAVGQLADRAGGAPLHGLLPWEVAEILQLATEWGDIDGSHRKLAHRGSYQQRVWVSASSVLRVLDAHGRQLNPKPSRRRRAAQIRRPLPAWVDYSRRQLWTYDVTHFPACGRVVIAILDMVSRYWVDFHVSVEETSTQVEICFTNALEHEGLLEEALRRGSDGLVPIHNDDERRPILLALSDNGPQMTSGSTREFMALHAIAMHLGRPGVPTDQAHIESFFGHLKTEFPYLEQIDDPAVLRTALVEVRRFYNDVRLHEALDYVTPSDEHHGRGPAIRQARRDGLEAARQQRLDYHRQQRANQGRQEAQDAG
jgi:putative transposase